MPSKPLVSLSVLAAVSLLAGCGGAQSTTREQIRAVGSSTVFPFAKAIAGAVTQQNPEFKSPIIESIGTGAGIKLFCGGVGVRHPDVANASRRMKRSEYDDCAAKGVTDIVEVQFGLDGIAFAEAKNGPGITLTQLDVYKALAANPFGKPNTTKNWSDVNPALPAIPILVYGPPSTSGTRDALKELILAKGCETDPAMKALKDSDKKRYDAVCTEVRSDGAYVDQGEQDNLIVQKLEANPQAVGVFGFSYLDENSDKLKGLPMNGVTPTYATISDFSYPGARPLYIYVKAAHLNAINGLKEFVSAWVANWGKDGLLARQGMVVSPDDVQARNAAVVEAMTLLKPDELK